jgi:hypothetical protein
MTAARLPGAFGAFDHQPAAMAGQRRQAPKKELKAPFPHVPWKPRAIMDGAGEGNYSQPLDPLILSAAAEEVRGQRERDGTGAHRFDIASDLDPPRYLGANCAVTTFRSNVAGHGVVPSGG